MSDPDFLIQKLTELAVLFVPKLLGVFLLLFVTWIVARTAGRAVTHTVEQKLDVTLSRFFGSLVRYGILVIGLLGSLRIFGFETTSFAALIGAAGLAVGLALQGTLQNFSAGVMLLIFRPFKVGDMVSVSGAMGKVTQISLFTTEFDTPDNRRLIVPNGSIFGSTIENLTFNEQRRVDVLVGTSYSADLDAVRSTLLEAAVSVEGRVQERDVDVVLIDMGDSSINWSVRVWAPTKDFLVIRDRSTRAVKQALDRAGIEIPFPQMDVHFDPPAGA